MRVLSESNPDKNRSSSDDDKQDGVGENPSYNGENRKEGDDPISGGGERDRGQYWMVAVSAAVLGSTLTVLGMWCLQRMGEDTFRKEVLLSDALTNARLAEGNECYIPMLDLESLIVNNVCIKDPSQTVMVCGPRGVGKSTAVYEALKNRTGVLHLNLTKVTLEEFENAILEAINFKSCDLPNVSVIHKALLDIRSKGQPPPIFIVEVNNQSKSLQLLDLLVRMKEWCSDHPPLAQFVIVLSLSQAALTIPVGLEELRVAVISIKDPPKNVIEKRFDAYLKTLKDYNSTEKERKSILDNHVSVLGTRFLYLMRLIAACKGEKCETVKQVQAVSERFTDAMRTKCEKVVQIFLDSNKALNDKKLLKDLVAGKADLYQVCLVVGKSRETFLNELADLHPHPIFVDPTTDLVLPGNDVAMRKFQELSNR